MATLDDIRTLGYEVSDLGATLEIVGHGHRFLINEGDQAAIDEIADPAFHEARITRPEPPSRIEAENARLMRERASQALEQLQEAVENWPTLTPEQKDAAQRLGLRSVARLIRLQLHRLESAS